jgi:hypothetical protein
MFRACGTFSWQQSETGFRLFSKKVVAGYHFSASNREGVFAKLAKTHSQGDGAPSAVCS